MDSMHIEVPSGKVFLNGAQVVSLKRKPYIMVDGEKIFLNDTQKVLARGMVKAFAPMIDFMEAQKDE